MKNIKTVRYFILGLLFFGCQEDFLEENPTSIIDPAALLTDKAGAEIYTVGAYDARIATKARNNHIWFDPA